MTEPVNKLHCQDCGNAKFNLDEIDTKYEKSVEFIDYQ